MDQAADVDVLVAEQRRPASLWLGLDPDLKLDQFPFHDVREGTGAAPDLPELALALWTHALPEVGRLGSLLHFVRDERGQGVQRGRRGGLEDPQNRGTKVAEGSLATGHTGDYRATAPATEAAAPRHAPGARGGGAPHHTAPRRPRGWNPTGGTGSPGG